MQVQVLGSVQVDFRLQVRKADLALISMKDLDILMNSMEAVLNLTIDKGYLVTSRVMLDGVMTSTNV